VVSNPALLSLGPPVRASDEERERTIDELTAHYARGRLREHDLEVRIASAYGARTRQELRMLVSDLPGAVRRSGWLRRLYVWQRDLFRYHVAAFAALNGLLLAAWWATGEGRFWPAAVLVPTSILIVSHGTFTRWLRDQLHRRD
jgi:hypothetical protein